MGKNTSEANSSASKGGEATRARFETVESSARHNAKDSGSTSSEACSELTTRRKSHRIHFGYVVVAALVITSFIPLSLGLSCAGIFYPSLSVSLGVEKGRLSYYTTFIWIAALVTLPLLGKLLGKVDARACLTGAVGLITAAFLWLSCLEELWQFYAAACAMGIGIAMLLFLAPSTLINRWFAKRAGAMLGIAMAFTGVGGAVFSSVGGVLIDSLGWTAAYRAFALLSACTIPVTLFMVRSHPSDMGLKPVGFSEEVTEAALDGVPAAEAYRSREFLLICALCFFLNIGMYVYFMIPSYAATLPVGVAFPLIGATASSFAMVGQTISKLALGAVGERCPNAGTIAALCLGMAGIGAFALFTQSALVYCAAALSFGLYYGITNVMMPLFTRRSFGNRDYAPIYAKVSMIASVSNAAAALIWGTIIDATGSFMPLFAGVAVLMTLSIATVIVLGRMGRAGKESNR